MSKILKTRISKGALALAGMMAGGLMIFSPVGDVYAEGGSCPAGMARGSYTNSIAECSTPESEGGDADGSSLWSVVNTIINIVLGIMGIVAVAMIILGGFRFLTSAGDAAKVKSGKDTILYGIIGLIIALLAFAIVNFVLNGVFGGDSAGGGSSSNGSSATSASSRSGTSSERETVETD